MSTPSHGNEQLAFVKVESAYDTPAAFTSDHGFGYDDMKITPKLDWRKWKEHVGTASLQGESKGKQGGEFSVTAKIKPNGAAIAPQLDPFIRAGGFAYDGGEYVLQANQLLSLQVGRKTGNSLYEVINGLWISKQEIKVEGSNDALMTFNGGFASYGALLGVPVTGAATYLAGVTQIAMAAAHAFKVRPGVSVAFGTQSNSGAGYRITAVSSDGLTLTFTPALAVGGLGASQTITPIVPTSTIAGEVVGGVEDGLTIAGTSVGFISYQMTHDTGIHGLDKESSANRPNRLAGGERSIAVEMMFYFLDENAGLLGKAWDGTVQRFQCRAGPDTAGSRFITETPALRLNVSPIELPDAEEATWKATGVARQDAAFEDELMFDTN